MKYFYTLEYYNYDSGTWEKGRIDDVFVLAIIPTPPLKDRMDICGLNICIVISEDPFKNKSDVGTKTKAALDKHFERTNGGFTVYLIGENGIKIPVDISGGNGWSEQYYGYKTCCYFGYVHPLMFGDTIRGRNYTI